MVERRFYVARIAIALAISIIIFLFILAFANWMSYNNYQTIEAKNKFVQNALVEMELALANMSCDGGVLVSASEKLDQVGAGLGLLEMRLGKNDGRVLEQKKLYSELEIRHLKMIQKMNENCSSSFVTLLFFYSNDENAQQRSDIAGTILNTFKRVEPSRVMVYSFDYNLDSESVQDLKSEYAVNSTPSVVVNGKDKINELDNISQLDKYLAN